MKKCAEIVVTYNRKKLLEENINALLEQSYKNHDIFIIDNASTDGTKEMINKYKDKRIKYFNTGKNIGGAGGFSFGIREALLKEYDYIWLMDDDSIPNEKALESLINKAALLNDDFSYLASLVYWTDGNLLQMNVPEINIKNKMDLQLDSISKNKIIPIGTSSFVGCFVNAKYSRVIGLPIREFFIYGDDVEYTGRLLKENKAFLDLDSIIIHKAPTNKGADISTDTEDRLQRYYYQSRNGMYIARKTNTRLKRLLVILKRTGKIILKSKNKKIRRIWLLYKGSIAGVFFNPKIEFVKKKKLIAI